MKEKGRINDDWDRNFSAGLTETSSDVTLHACFYSNTGNIEFTFSLLLLILSYLIYQFWEGQCRFIYYEDDILLYYNPKGRFHAPNKWVLSPFFGDPFGDPFVQNTTRQRHNWYTISTCIMYTDWPSVSKTWFRSYCRFRCACLHFTIPLDW